MYDEVEKVLNKLKSNKSAGWDNIPNEVIKNKSVYVLLLKYFQKYFDSSFVPSIVSPIPKSATKDPHTPLNYRGNNRILLYCNMSNILVDKQNGFRSGRSCEEHIFL